MATFDSARLQTATAVALLVLLGCALYLPYLGSPLIYDDKAFFSGYRFSDYASSPLGLGLRQPSYFSLAFVQVVFGGIVAHRIVSLALHLACACALYAVVRAFSLSRLTAFAVAALFAVHPVAVYAAGYLVQRSIVVATLFSLLSLLLYMRGLRRLDYSDALAAGLLYGLAVLSKEHAVLVAATTLIFALILTTDRRFALRYTAVYLAVCAPFAILVLALSKGLIGASYEPHFDTVAAQVQTAAATTTYWTDALTTPWIGNAIAQCAVFFRYLWTWLVPQTDAMSLDIRVPFADYWSPAVALPVIFCFVGSAVLAGWLALRRGRIGLIAAGFLYVWVTFLVEFTAVRFQEPFVLYRSYLWAPGVAIAVAAALEGLSRRTIVLLLLPALALLSWQARDRLDSLSSGLKVWEDAAEKLPREAIPGGHRALYEAGREYFYAGNMEKAVETVERCTRLYPTTFDCFFARAAIDIELKNYETALPHILQAVALRPHDGAARHHLGLILENLGCPKEAKVQYQLAVAARITGAQYRIDRIEHPGVGLLPPVESPPETGRCSPERLKRPLPRG